MIKQKHALFTAVEDEIISRLSVVAMRPQRILALGCDTLQTIYPEALITDDEQQAPFDMIVANVSALWSFDSLEQVFAEWHRLLNPEGLLMFALCGPETLQAYAADVPSKIDMHHVGDLLAQIGFADPVMDVEHFDLKYKNSAVLREDLAIFGVASIEPSPQILNFEIVYGHAWRPHAREEGSITIPLEVMRRQLKEE